VKLRLIQTVDIDLCDLGSWHEGNRVPFHKFSGSSRFNPQECGLLPRCWNYVVLNRLYRPAITQVAVLLKPIKPYLTQS
jgi:hypothetical protein